MILSDKTIKDLLAKGDLVIDPITENSIQPASVDCRIGSHYLVIDDTQIESGILSFDKEIKYREINNDTVIIPPHSFLLATTMEYIKVPNGYTAFVEGRSSIGRMGLLFKMPDG